MAKQLISYDLSKPDRDYPDLHEAIKNLGTWWHCLGSVWIVVTNLSASQVRDQLASHIDADDKLGVFPLSGDWATQGFDDNCNNWLRTNM